MPRDRRKKRDIHALNEKGMVARNPRDAEAAHRVAVGDIATAEGDSVTCRTCLDWVLHNRRRVRQEAIRK